MTREDIVGKMKANFDEDIVDLFMGETIVYDENGNRVKLCDVPCGSRVEYVKYKKVTFDELKKAFKDCFDYKSSTL